ncbi:FkbM family methyltransferase [Actinoplanes sp. NBRC 103695]|uniref:FkbM family methyltransferase n=1 Tax=Actinoplanes sp. NBRC 103695 TaxID=3032202 RepID=UPI0024A57A3E|nr:FkbM family methyltransferase [Actinoplanes sp. NBRC 103695]GLY97582.1 hypothetical protein Acsp02_48360 [Actinoplanes sp. NBRC 103695]
MLTITRHGITSQFDTSPWPDETPSLYRPFLQGVYYEQGFLDHIRALDLHGVYVDAGSCLGTHTVWFGVYCPSTYVHAFDPRERCARWTQMNVDANDLGAKTTVHNVGLGARPGSASADLDGIVENFEVLPLDKIVKGKVAVIKIDVEGMEVEVLNGARRILRESRPHVFAEAFNKDEFEKIKVALAPYGYKATGKVFNSTPTYEFVPIGNPRELALKRAAHKLPKPLFNLLKSVRNAVRGNKKK